MVSPCFGILTRLSTCTRLKQETLSTPLSSPPTDTGYVPPPPAASKSSIWRASALDLSRNLVVALIPVILPGRLSMNSNQNVPTPARSRSRYVCRSLGQQTARHCLVVSPMTLFESGALFRDYLAGLFVYYMSCCTLKITRCCIHVLSLHYKCMMRKSETESDVCGAPRMRAMRMRRSFDAEDTYASISPRRLRTRSSYVYLSIPPKSILMVPVEILTCNSHMCDTLALQLSPLLFVSALGERRRVRGLRCGAIEIRVLAD